MQYFKNTIALSINLNSDRTETLLFLHIVKTVGITCFYRFKKKIHDS